MMSSTANSVHVVLDQTSAFDGKKADDSLRRSFKLRASHIIYIRAIFDIL